MDAISVNENEISGSEWLKFGFFSILLNRDMKSRLGSLPMTNESDVLNKRVEGYMSLLSEDCDLVKSFFTYTPARYAA